MKTLPDLRNIETLEKFKANLSEAVDKEIERRKIEEKVSSIDSMSLGHLSVLFESLGSALFNENKELIGKYVKTIKENKSLRTLYALYENATSPAYTKNSASLVDTMVNLSESLDKKELNEGLKKLRGIVKEGVVASNVNSNEFDAIVNGRKELNESLDYIFSTKPNAKNVFEYTDKKDFVVNYINENMAQESADNETVTTDDAVEEYKNIFEGLESWESEAVRDLSLHHLSESSGEELFNRYKDECLTVLNEKIESTDSVDEVSRLSVMKEHLSEKKYVEDKLDEDILKLADLKHTLQD